MKTAGEKNGRPAGNGRSNIEEGTNAAVQTLQTLLHASPLAIVVYDAHARITLWNRAAVGIFGWGEEDVLGKHNPAIIEDCVDKFISQFERTQAGESVTGMEMRMLRKEGSFTVVNVSMAPLADKNGKITGVLSFCEDISAKKQAEDQLKYISFHDSLTNLYNRAYFQEELARLDTGRQLPLSLIMGDVNGLKLINDVFGHTEGDKLLQKAANAMGRSCRADDIVARLGGDEFAILLPCTDSKTVVKICERITAACESEHMGSMKVSISIGSATRNNGSMSIRKLFKEAEDRMYRNKLLESKKVREMIIMSLNQTLYHKCGENENHIRRLETLTSLVARKLGFKQDERELLTLLSRLHDIGKIALSDSILCKPGALTADEWNVVKRHSEIGYRIAESSNDFSNISLYILTHHEHWDGSGYPLGFKENDIPYLSRILAIADAYDVMTTGRPFRKAMSREKAEEELGKYSGIWFDPALVVVFLEVLKDRI